MKKIVVLLAALGLLVSLVACGKSASNNSSFGKGKVMALEFETNPSTGFTWEYKFEGGNGEVVFDREENKINNEQDLVGAPHKVTYYFKAAKEGNRNLRFTYRRPWEGGDVAYDVVYELSVDKDLNISCLSKMKGNVDSNKELNYFPNPTFSN